VQGTVAISGDLRPGGTVTVSATGLASDASGFAVAVHSDPVSLGTGSTDAAGAFTLQAALPASLPAGAHTVTVSFGGTTVASASFTVAPASAGNGGGSTPGSGSGGSAGSGSASAGSLATTGSEASIGLGIAGVVVIAAGVLLLARRRATLDAD
jgi:LPXTG-motif cell wall-anchored protein